MLAQITIAFLVGLLVGSGFPFTPFLCIGFLLLTAIVLVGLERSGWLHSRHSSMLYAGLLVGLLYWTVFAWLSTPVSLHRLAGNAPLPITGRITEPVHYAPGRASFHLTVSQLGNAPADRHRDGTLRITWREPGRDLKQGDLVTLTARIHPPSGQVNPGGFDYATYLIRHGVDATASVSGPDAVRWLGSTNGLTRWALWRTVDEWRDRIRNAAVASLRDPARGIYLGIIVGQPGYLTAEVRDAFMATGTVHILSISGSHLGLVGLLSFFLIRHTCRRLPAQWLLGLSRHITSTRIAALGTVIPVTIYALLAGAEVATVRSWIMIVVFLLSVWLGRQEHLLLSLACAAFLIALHDPRALYDISFQLSYCSVLAIALVIRRPSDESGEHLPPSRSIRKRLEDWLTTYAWITGGITLATLPLVAYHFNQVAWLGLVANLVVVPLAGLLLVPLGLGSALWVAATGNATLPGTFLNQAGMDFLSDLVHMLARLPGAEWHVASPTLISIVLFYGLLIMAISLPAHHRVRLICFTGAIILVAWWVWSPRMWGQDGSLRVTFLDVGQGDATVIELPDGETVLIDAGTRHETWDMGRSVVAPYLWDRSIFRLDHVIATHPQLDHIGGLASVLRHFPVGHYWSNGLTRQELFYQELQRALRHQGLSESIAVEGEEILATGTCRLSVLNPAVGEQPQLSAPTNIGTLLNNQSVVTKLLCGPHSFLFAADAEAQTLSRMAKTDVSASARIVKVPHHGANSSLDEQWIRHVAPEIAVISVGDRNPYGHPTQAVLRAYEQQGSRIFRTDRDGAVSIAARLSSPLFELSRARATEFRPIRFGASMFHDEWLNWGRLRCQMGRA
ncbi:MAG: DNA internalization-related competence protein ComEC/Rec2 [Nitrospirae bacterium]|nr:MAG: DNA internalization-related competence protein ComEC/Rec2 [Nitrospirota bacterium]